MSTKQNLMVAKSLINTPRKWRRGGSIDGGRMCVVNAIIEAAGVVQSYPCEAAICAALGADEVSRDRIAQFNDRTSTTHAEVMALFDRAIQAAEA